MRIFPADARVNKVHFDLDYLENVRLNDILHFWKFYNGQHWTWAREQGEPQTTINLSKRIVDIGVEFLMGNGFSVDSNVDENKKEIIPLLKEVWEENDAELLGQEIALVGGVTGDAWVEVTWKEGKGVVLTCLDSTMVYPLWNPHDKDDMLQITIMYPAWEKMADMTEGAKDLWHDPRGGKGKALRTYMYRKVYTREKIREYHDDEKVTEVPNPLGVIPIAHIKNFATTGWYGESDLKDIVGLNREYNEKITDASDIINYHAGPTTVIFGARANALEKGARKIWSGLPKDSRVENLELQTDLPAINVFLENIKKAIYDIGAIPPHALGEPAPVSNTSGVALQMLFHPLVKKIKKKKTTYNRGLKRVNAIIMLYMALYAGFDLEKLERPFETHIVYPPMLPKDEALDMQLQLEKLNAKLTSRVRILMEEYMLSEEEATKRIQEADEDAMNQQKQQMEMTYEMQMQNPMFNTEGDTGGGQMNQMKRQNNPEVKGATGQPPKAAQKAAKKE